MATSLCAQAFSGFAHVGLIVMYYLTYEGMQFPSMMVLWNSWSSWLNVLLAAVMVLRNHGVGWAESFYGVEKRKKALRTSSAVQGAAGGVAAV